MKAGELLGLYEQMAVIRGTEQAAHDLFLAGLVERHHAPGGRARSGGGGRERGAAAR